jgi:ATP-dependent 26S proteasome regulatory subunit
MSARSEETYFIEDLKTRIRAGCPLTYIVTREEGRLIGQFESISCHLGRKLWRHTLTEGLSELSVIEFDPLFPEVDWEKPLTRYRDPIAVLEFIGKAKAGSGIFLLIDFHEVFSDGVVRRKLKDLAEVLRQRMNAIIFVSPFIDMPSGLSHEVCVLHHPPPEEATFQHCLKAIKQSLERRKVPIQLDPIGQELLVCNALWLTQQRFEDCLARYVARKGMLDTGVLTELIEEKKEKIRATQILELVTDGVTDGQVGGLQNFLDWLRKREKLFSLDARRFGLPYPKGVLMIGVPGCGKSLAAKTCAAILNQPLVRLDVGRLFAAEVGRSEANVRRALDILEKSAPCVLWVDEIEKAMAGINGTGQADGGTSLRVFATLLSWFQERQAPVFMVATANAIGQLPPELFRKGRWDEVFFVDLPGEKDREAIFSIHLEQRNQNPKKFDLAGLARAAGGYSGAEIEQAVVSALVEAFYDSRPLKTADILQAVSEQIPLWQSMKEDIAALREWAVSRARWASPGYRDEEHNQTHQRKLRAI